MSHAREYLEGWYYVDRDEAEQEHAHLVAVLVEEFGVTEQQAEMIIDT